MPRHPDTAEHARGIFELEEAIAEFPLAIRRAAERSFHGDGRPRPRYCSAVGDSV